MATITATEITTAANWIAQILQRAGYHTDGTPASLWEIDRFIREHTRNGQPVAGGMLATDARQRIFALGCYVGETLRHALGGQWDGDTGDAPAEINITLHLPDGAVIWPVQRIIKRIQVGEGDGIAAYGIGLGLDVGPPPTKEIAEAPPLPEKKPWWKVW